MGGLLDYLRRFWDRIFELIVAPALRAIYGAPRIQHAQVETRDATVQQADYGHCHLQLGTNAIGQTGFELDVFFTAPTKPGQIEFVQLVKPNRTRIPGPPPDNAEQIFTSDNEWVLDKQDPYGGLTFPLNPGAGGPPGNAMMTDTPRSACVRFIKAVATGGLELVAADDRSCAFIMWRPNALGGRRRIPLGHVTWHWDGEAGGVDNNEDCSSVADSATSEIGKWKLTSPPDNHGWLKHIPNMRRRPRWTRNVTAIKWRDKHA